MTETPVLHHHLRTLVTAWREGGYPAAEHPALTEILDWLRDDEGQSRFLRSAQIEALETYWYLREVRGTPLTIDLYRDTYTKSSELRRSLGLDFEEAATIVEDNPDGFDALVRRVREDDDFASRHKLEALRETLDLQYPSYILALAMGAGKTVLIGAIIATEFAMAMEYPESDYIANALVFAPGLTIPVSLRELYAIPYDRILPPRMHNPFMASVNMTFTRDGEKDIPVVRGSLYNLIVTNTEKIRIQKETIRKSDIGRLLTLYSSDEDGARAEVANRRLQAVASLPHLGVFSDEAHHTYGQALDKGLKKVRKTVDYLAANTNLLCVINTTGTPYYKKKMLPDVVNWYGLSAGITDGILKDVANNIVSYDVDDVNDFVQHVITDFFQTYGQTTLPTGAPAKLAIYFPQTADIHSAKPVIDAALVSVGLDPSVCLTNTSDNSLTSETDIAAFHRLNDPAAPHRLILLVNKGTEGWNCPSLFSTALARQLKNANNFVLQAATRCLRQVPGNSEHARIYLSPANFSILDRQLKETYGEGIDSLNDRRSKTKSARLVLRKRKVAPLEITQEVSIVEHDDSRDIGPLKLTMPTSTTTKTATKRIYTTASQVSTASVLAQVGEDVTVELSVAELDHYTVAVDLARTYRLGINETLAQIRNVYRSGRVPASHLGELASQIESQTMPLRVRRELVTKSIALIKEDGFAKDVDSDGNEHRYTEILYPVGNEHLLLTLDDFVKAGHTPELGFHYDPYNFDSKPEKSFFEQLVRSVGVEPAEVDDIYFTGAMTDPRKTDFFIEYRDKHGKWRRYSPDFVIRTKATTTAPSKVLIVEIKAESQREDPIDGEAGKKAQAVRKWETVNPNRVKYYLLFTNTDAIATNQVAAVIKNWKSS